MEFQYDCNYRYQPHVFKQIENDHAAQIQKFLLGGVVHGINIFAWGGEGGGWLGWRWGLSLSLVIL